MQAPLKEIDYLNRLVDSVYNRALEMNWDNNTLAKRAGLSHETVWRLGKRITSYPRLQTVWMLTKAVGMQLALSDLKIKRAKGRRAA